MNKFFNLPALVLLLVFSACGNVWAQKGSQLEPSAFSRKIKELPDAVVLDVRTPQEYNDGHLKNALNLNWNDAAFLAGLEQIRKDRTVLVYCHSGGRSAAAVKKLNELGYKSVYELKGGITSWRAAKMPEARP
jgi:rhodanese-related sulfurtransferase